MGDKRAGRVRYSSAFFHAALSLPTLLSFRIIVCRRLERRKGMSDLMELKFFSKVSVIFSNSWSASYKFVALVAELVLF